MRFDHLARISFNNLRPLLGLFSADLAIDLGTVNTRIRSHSAVGECAGQKHGQESPKIASHSPFDEHILRRYFSLLDCAAGAQSRANQFGRRNELKTCDLQSTIARRSPFGGIRKGTAFPDSSAEANSPDETCMLQNPLHVAHTSALSGPTQKVTKVRISISPPHSLGCREIGLHHSKHR